MAQRKEHEAIAKQFKALEEIREAELIQREYDLDHQLTEKHKAREARHKQYLKNIEAFQMTQIKKNKDDAKEFASALRDAFKLIKHTSGNDVYVEYRNSN